ncbi:MAG TPA: hypothetical protein VN903_38750, partial [Polyangia bacterium]|nr:hypothetical protein [Polyangia bacterium]
ARAARVDDAGNVHLALSDGSEEPLDPTTLTVDDAGVLRAWVRDGRLEARLATSAAAVLGDALTVSDDGLPRLQLAGQLVLIPRRSAT